MGLVAKSAHTSKVTRVTDYNGASGLELLKGGGHYCEMGSRRDNE
jgi:hypothetical protein